MAKIGIIGGSGLYEMEGLEVLETSPTVGQMWVQDPDGNIIELIAPPV